MDTFLPASFWFCNLPKKNSYSMHTTRHCYLHLHKYVCVRVCMSVPLPDDFGDFCIRMRAYMQYDKENTRHFSMWNLQSMMCLQTDFLRLFFSYSHSVICFLSFQPEISSSSFSSIQTKAHPSSFINLRHCGSIGIEGKEQNRLLLLI